MNFKLGLGLSAETNAKLYSIVACYSTFCLLCQMITTIVILSRIYRARDTGKGEFAWNCFSSLLLMFFGVIVGFCVPMVAFPTTWFENLLPIIGFTFIIVTMIFPLWPFFSMFFWLNPFIMVSFLRDKEKIEIL